MTTCVQLNNCNSEMNYGICIEDEYGKGKCDCASTRFGNKCEYEKCKPSQYFSVKENKCVDCTNCNENGGVAKGTECSGTTILDNLCLGNSCGPGFYKYVDSKSKKVSCRNCINCDDFGGYAEGSKACDGTGFENPTCKTYCKDGGSLYTFGPCRGVTLKSDREWRGSRQRAGPQPCGSTMYLEDKKRVDALISKMGHTKIFQDTEKTLMCAPCAEQGGLGDVISGPVDKPQSGSEDYKKWEMSGGRWCKFKCPPGQFYVNGSGCFSCDESSSKGCGEIMKFKDSGWKVGRGTGDIENQKFMASGLPYSFGKPSKTGQCATGTARTLDLPTCTTTLKPSYCGQKGGLGPFGGKDGCDENINNIKCTYFPPKCPAGYKPAGTDADGLKWSESKWKRPEYATYNDDEEDYGPSFRAIKDFSELLPSKDPNVGPTNPCTMGTDMRRCLPGNPIRYEVSDPLLAAKSAGWKFI